MSCTVTRVLGMPYYPPEETQNRVDAIKKKFEDVEKKHEKPLVKRSPAFRCDRIVCGKNVTNISPKNKPTWTSAQSDSEVKTINRPKSAKTSPTVDGFQKSLSENNLIGNKEKHDYRVKFISHEKNILGKNDNYTKLLAEYSVVNKQKKDKSPELSEKVRLALQSPLPVGPPPKKPPRIFTHTPQKEAKSDARLKLEKIENFMLKHEKHSHVIVPRKNEEVKKSLGEKENEQSGLPSFSCLSECVTDVGNPYVKKNEKRSEFYVDDVKKSSVDDTCDKVAKKGGNAFNNGVSVVPPKPPAPSTGGKRTEPIYAQPFRHTTVGTDQGASFKTFGKTACVTSLKPPSLSPPKTDSPLHYMCTDLTQPVHLDWRHSETLRVERPRQPPPGVPPLSPLLPRTSIQTPTSQGVSNASRKFNEVLPASQSPPSVPNPASQGVSPTPRSSPSLPTSLFYVGVAGLPIPPRTSAPPGLPIPPRVSSTGPPSPPYVEGVTTPEDLKDVRLLMNQAFGPPMPDTASLDSDEASGPDTPEDTPSLELTANGHDNTQSPASSPSLNSISSNTDNESLSQLTAKRKVYVKRVSSHLLAADRLAVLQSRAENKQSVSHLFESCLLIGLTLTDGQSGQKKNLPYVKSFFPPHVKPPPLIEFFCFPDADAWPPPVDRQSPEEQTYSIVLTNERGERKFGYCRRVLPEGSHFCLPLAYCIISPHRATGFYYTVLQELESRHGSPELDTLMKELYENEFPNPGQSLKLSKILERAKRTSPVKYPEDSVPSTLVRRPTDIRLENRDVTQLFRHLSIPVFIKVFSSILLERKVLLLGNSLSTLSCCIEALQSVLYPFSWQHTYVPVLPAHLLELCEAPTPYIIGVLKQPDCVETTLASRFSEGIMVDIEESRVVVSCKDENSILPPKLRKSLRSALTLATTALPGTALPDSEQNVLVSETFLRFFVEVCGHYAHHVLPQQDGLKAFQKDTFIKAVHSSSTQSFLEWFTETAMFHVFIQDRVQYDVHDLFWKRSLQHSAEVEKNSVLFSKNSRSVNKKVKTLGDRIKDLTTFSK